MCFLLLSYLFLLVVRSWQIKGGKSFMKTIDVFLQVLLALFAFFWLFIFIFAFPYPINIIFFADVTLALLIVDKLREEK